MRRFALVVSGLLGVAVAGCSSTPRFEPAELKQIRDVEVQVLRQWSQSIGAVGTLRALRPIAVAGRVFVADAQGRVHSISAEGQSNWSVETGRRLSAGPVLVDGQLIVGDRDGGLLALAATDGSELWSQMLSSEVQTVPAGDAGLLAVKTEDGRLHGLEPATGEPRWVVPLTVPQLTWRGNAPLVIADDLLLLATSTGRVKALDRADGSLVWEQSIAEPTGRSEVERLTDIDGDLLLAGPVIVAVSTAGTTKVIRRDGGQLIWERSVGGYTGASIDETCLYVVDKDDAVSCLDPRSGAAVWTNDNLEYRRLTAAVPYKGNVLVGDFDGYVHVLSAADGRIIGRTRVARGGVNWLGRGADERLLVLTENGRISSLDVEPLSLASR